jgi:hypothetical protein
MYPYMYTVRHFHVTDMSKDFELDHRTVNSTFVYVEYMYENLRSP